MFKPILCVDFDGVINSYTSGWKGETVIPDPPVPGALQWLWKATEIFEVRIYSSRFKTLEGVGAVFDWMVAHSRVEFGKDHPMSNPDPALLYPVNFLHAYEKPPAFLTIDDRAICFEGDWSKLEPCALLDFKPWHQRLISKEDAVAIEQAD